jgi:hypothetical protein
MAVNGPETTVEEQTRSPEEQAVIDSAIDILAQRSVAKGGNHLRQEGITEAVLILATELDGTVHGYDRLARFYADDYAAQTSYRSPDSLRVAVGIVESYPTTPEVTERVLAACIANEYVSYRADDIAHNILGRNLTETEVLEIVKGATGRSGKSSGDREQHLHLAIANRIGSETIGEINRLFDERDRQWADID